jgi:hypothetical protein
MKGLHTSEVDGAQLPELTPVTLEVTAPAMPSPPA